MESNTSGQSEHSIIPDEIKGWNWGAFFFNWIWGISNQTYRAFWVLFPFFGIFMMFVLGAKGNEWAWRHKKWDSVEQFKKTQRRWAQAALVFLLGAILFAFLLVFFVTSVMKSTYAYETSFNEVSQSKEVISVVGLPMKSGMPSGSVSSTNTSGDADIAYDIEGPNGEATVMVEAKKTMGKWSIHCLVVVYEETEKQTTLVPCH